MALDEKYVAEAIGKSAEHLLAVVEERLSDERGHDPGDGRVSAEVANYVNQRLSEYGDRIERMLSGHIRDETDEFSGFRQQFRDFQVELNGLRDLIAQSIKLSEARHAELVRQIDAQSARQSAIEAAFPRTDNGELDLHGHRQEHQLRKQAIAWWESVRRNVIVKVLEWGAVGFIVLAGSALWRTLLAGPGG